LPASIEDTAGAEPGRAPNFKIQQKTL